MLQAPTAVARNASRQQIVIVPPGKCPNEVAPQISNGVNAGVRFDTCVHPCRDLPLHGMHVELAGRSWVLIGLSQ